MLLASERESVVHYCQKMAQSSWGTGTSGNISVFDAVSGLVAISPSSMDYAAITAADIVVLDLHGEVVDSQRRPSSEYMLHLACYRDRQDMGAIVHTHAPQATTLATLGWDLPAVHYMIAYSGRATVPCVPYELFGTEALAEAAASAMHGGYAVLLENHGTLAGGSDLPYAYAVTEQLEFCAGLYLRAKSIGEPKILSDEQIEAAIARFSKYKPQA